MITLYGHMLIPQGWTAEGFDDWYLSRHVEYGKNSPHICRYAVNRAVSRQPPVAKGGAFRVSEECWRSFEDAERSWNLPLGSAVLGDAVANLGALDAAAMPGVAITQDREFVVSDEVRFSPLRRGFAHAADGTICKFIAFGASGRGAAVGELYEQRYGKLGLDPRVRAHYFGTSLGRKLRAGRLVTFPGALGQQLYDWVLGLWFENSDSARQFLESSAFLQMWREMEPEVASAALYRGQEMMVVCDPVAHRDD